jgi:hypothetical protein
VSPLDHVAALYPNVAVPYPAFARTREAWLESGGIDQGLAPDAVEKLRCAHCPRGNF